MYVQMVTFRLNGVSEEQYHEVCAGETTTFAGLPGLLSKIWLRDSDGNTYGGIYLWRDRAAHDEYVRGEVFRSIATDPNFSDVNSVGFDVFEDLTQETQPALAVV